MTLTFNPAIDIELDDDIQFDVNGDEAGIYYLAIANGECTFYEVSVRSLILTIITIMLTNVALAR